jgi:GntR family histidine utilization transcriptional repressor
MSDVKPMPVYARIKVDILGNIDKGLWRPGDRIPSEHNLVKQFGVSRMTVNRALRELSDDGRLLRIPGTGTFVASPNTDSGLLEIQSVDDHISAQGGVHRSEILHLKKIRAEKEIAATMEIGEGDDLFHVYLLHMNRDVPFQLENRYVNADLVPGFGEQDFTKFTPTRFLVAEVPFTEIEHSIEAVSPNAEEARYLGIADDEPCLVLRRRTWWNSSVVTQVNLLSPGSLFKLSGRFKPFSRR